MVKMCFLKITLLVFLCKVTYGSVLHDSQQLPAGAAPIVTAASSQYFERIFNRLVAAPALEQVPVALPPLPHVIPASAAPPVVVEATRTTLLQPPRTTPQNQPNNPNVAIAVATANAAAPVATILLPPYPFGFPPGYNFIPQPTANFPDQNEEQSTIQPSTKTMKTTTQREQESTTPLPSNFDGFVQPLPSNDSPNVFRQYAPPQQIPQPPQQIPQPPQQIPQPPQQFQQPQRPHIPTPIKLKTKVEVVPVPLTYIAPPPMLHHHHHHPHHSLKLKVPIHTYIPKTKIIIIRPKYEAYRVIRIPHAYRAKQRVYTQSKREMEALTVRPVNRPFTKPPRL